ncbi:MAG: DUF1499 domain-containing protein [Betaproteobacteria bacterium]|nr:DUF1499 domain-containing protein [Betaproteobacteria bacterium]
MRTLPPCPASPNCVSSLAAAGSHYLAPMPYKGDRKAAQRTLEDIVRAARGATVVRSEPGYFAAEFRTLILRFVDDVEFLFDEQARLIHFRSASRTGYSDFGVNRTRLRKLATAFAAAQS